MSTRKIVLDKPTQTQLAKDLFNLTWTYLTKPVRTPAEDDLMLHAAHASCFHWSEVGEPVHGARGHWQVARVNAVLKRPEAALHHAQRCLDICLENRIGDWDLAFAYEAIARAYRIAGNEPEFDRFLSLARQAAAEVAEAEDRELLEKDLSELAVGTNQSA